MSENTTERKWRFGVNRWILLAIIIGGIMVTSQYPPVRPAILLNAEAILGSNSNPLFYFPILNTPFYLTNTLVATVLADIFLLVLLIFVVVPHVRRGADAVPRGLANAVEGFLEILYNLTESTAGTWTRKIFPWFATITMMVLVMNWMELIPGVDAIGNFDMHHYADEYVEEAAEAEGLAVSELTADELHRLEEEAEAHYWDICADASGQEGQGETVLVYRGTEEGTGACALAVVPWVRAVATDLNFTIGLAIVSVVMIQVVGVQALGISYFEKFFNVRSLFTKPFFGVIDFAVGLFEIVSELSKIISFSFRLFGNIFAGAVLLFVIGTLIPVVAQAGVLMLEFGVGLIQAIVFGMLTMVFMAQATHSHHGDEEEHH